MKGGGGTKRIFLYVGLFACALGAAFCDDWVLAAQKFEFADSRSAQIADESLTTIMPQLIMERISEGLVRSTSLQEMHDRTRNDLLTERQSLFLQLAKEVKVRDALVVTEPKDRKLKKELKEEEEKIAEIEAQIDENLQKTQKLKEELYQKTTGDKRDMPPPRGGRGPLPFNPFANLFVKKEDDLLPDPTREQIVFYKSDPYVFFTPSDDAKKFGIESRLYETEVIKEKINALLTGKIAVYGSHFSLSCKIWNFPGAKVIGEIVEVGSMKSWDQTADAVAGFFIPKIANSFPIEIRFTVEPAEAKEDALLKVDGNVYVKVPDKIIALPGEHFIEVECSGYVTKSVDYDFQGARRFLVEANMKKKTDVKAQVHLENPLEGSLYLGSDLAGEITFDSQRTEVFFDGTDAIGQFVSKGDEDALFFFYIPEKLQQNGASLVIKGKPSDRASVIDRRRIVAYRAYTAVVLSVPITLFCLGKYYAIEGAYNRGSMEDSSEMDKWQNYTFISLGVTMGCLGFFIFELSRYLKAANSLLPAKVKIEKYKHAENDDEGSQNDD